MKLERLLFEEGKHFILISISLSGKGIYYTHMQCEDPIMQLPVPGAAPGGGAGGSGDPAAGGARRPEARPEAAGRRGSRPGRPEGPSDPGSGSWSGLQKQNFRFRHLK